MKPPVVIFGLVVLTTTAFASLLRPSHDAKTSRHDEGRRLLIIQPRIIGGTTASAGEFPYFGER